MTRPPRLPAPLAGLCAAALVAACGSSTAQGPAVQAASAPSAARLLEPITALIGDAGCDDPGQCKVVGIGAKPCGGPSRYLAWSSKTTDPAALRAAVQAQAEAQKREDAARGLVSDCRAAPEPTAVCRPRPYDGKKTCQLGQGGVRSAV